MATSPSTTPAVPLSTPFLQHTATDWKKLATWMGVCPHSQTMTAYDLDLESSLIYALPCNQWACRHCASRKTKTLARKTVRAKPNRLCTLTVDPSLYTSPRHAFDCTRRKVPEWVRVMRSRHGEVEYLRVTEITKRGFPHYHMLIRSGFIPHNVARDEWALLTGATIVDIRQVKKIFNCYTYLLKYLTKMHRIEWTGRHVSYSRQFFLRDDQPDHEARRLELKVVHNHHPATHILEEWEGQLVTQLSARTYRLGEDKPLLDRMPYDEAHLASTDPWVEPLDYQRQAETRARQEFMSWIQDDPGGTRVYPR